MNARLPRSRRSLGRRILTGALAVGSLLVAAIAVSGAPAAADSATAPTSDQQRIQFEPGTDNATRDGFVTDGVTDRWYLNARAGQTFAITIDSADNNTVFSVFAPDRTLLANVSATQAEANTFWTGVLPADGDYTVEITSLGGSAYYQMKVWIDAGYMDPLGLVQRISFAPGTSSGEGLGSVIRASTDTWVLTARAGQTMDVSVTPAAGGGTTFDVYAPDGSAMTAPDQRSTWSGQLPIDGDYRVAVQPTGGNSDYSIRVSITGGNTGGGSPTQVGDPEYNPGNVSNPNPDPLVLSAGGVTQRISFEPGSDHAIISNSLAPGMADHFILGAAAGQQLNAWIESDTGEVTVAAFAPDGEPLTSPGFDVYVVSLSASGDYELEVWNQSTIVSAYTLTVYIT